MSPLECSPRPQPTPLVCPRRLPKSRYFRNAFSRLSTALLGRSRNDCSSTTLSHVSDGASFDSVSRPSLVSTHACISSSVLPGLCSLAARGARHGCLPDRPPPSFFTCRTTNRAQDRTRSRSRRNCPAHAGTGPARDVLADTGRARGEPCRKTSRVHPKGRRALSIGARILPAENKAPCPHLRRLVLEIKSEAAVLQDPARAPKTRSRSGWAGY